MRDRPEEECLYASLSQHPSVCNIMHQNIIVGFLFYIQFCDAFSFQAVQKWGYVYIGYIIICSISRKIETTERYRKDKLMLKIQHKKEERKKKMALKYKVKSKWNKVCCRLRWEMEISLLHEIANWILMSWVLYCKWDFLTSRWFRVSGLCLGI